MACAVRAWRSAVSTALVVPLLPSTTLTSVIASTGAASSSTIVTTPWPSLMVALVAAVRFTKIDWKSVVEGKGGDLRGGRMIKKKRKKSSGPCVRKEYVTD